ncbi:MAG: 30S ribosomal protein S8 [Candidatus Parcubacteria bacterium]|nr:MAG: 30S ribosomal protein S8 [Candidatus Parcubacteria bacterium]
MTDPIADLLTRIRNALRVNKTMIEVNVSKMAIAIAKILKDNSLINDFKINQTKPPKMVIFLKYSDDGKPFIEDLKRISKPGRRVYAGYKDLKPLRSGFAFRIVSTNRGVMIDSEAKRRKLGGEIICEVYY